MKTLLEVAILSVDRGVEILWKKIEVPFVPEKGMLVEDEAWPEPLPIQEVRLCLYDPDPNIHVILRHNLQAGRDMDQEVKAFKACGWSEDTD